MHINSIVHTLPDERFKVERTALSDEARQKLHPVFISNEARLARAFRAGEYTPEGERIAFLLSDGAVLSYRAAYDNVHEVFRSVRAQAHDGWCPVEVIHADKYQGPVTCSHTQEKLW